MTTTRSTVLEDALPVYDFEQRHGRWIDARPEQVWDALTSLTFGQLRITRPLMAIRHLGRDASHAHRSVFTQGPVHILEVTAPEYAVGGFIARPWQLRPQRHAIDSITQFAAFTEPGWVRCLTDFQLQPHRGGVQLTTLTRGRSTDATSRRRFARYWAFIRPASDLVRRDLLASVARSATRGESGPPVDLS